MRRNIRIAVPRTGWVTAVRFGSGRQKRMSGRITALKAQQRNPQRINVFIDGEFAFGLERITAAWLRVGQELSEQKIQELKQQDTLEVAYRKALRFLESRPHSENEIRKNLAKKGVTEEVTEQILERLRRSGLVNDEQFAAMWVQNRSEFRPRSRKALAYEMRRRGIASETIDEALTGYEDKEETLAYQAAAKQARRYQNLERTEFRRKLSGFLARRGFNYEVIAPVIERVWNEFTEKRATE